MQTTGCVCCLFHENDIDDQGPAAPSEAWPGSHSPLDPLEASRPKNDQSKIPGHCMSLHVIATMRQTSD